MGVQQAHFCEGGASVLTTASGITRLWQIPTGECMLTFSGSCAHLFELNHALPRPSGSQHCSTEGEKRERKDKMHMAHKEKKHRETKCEENAEKLFDEAQCEEEAKEKHDQQHETTEKKEKKDKNEREDDGEKKDKKDKKEKKEKKGKKAKEEKEERSEK